tara:strand:+ start:2973 stop:3464 length:492 start_codon:yes stop_codon:yes gene_type:complete
MADDKKKDERKFYKKKRYILSIGFVLFCAFALVSGSNTTNKLIEECNEGKNEKCDELLEDWSSYVESESDQAKITNPYLIEKFKKLNEAKAKKEKKKAEEQQRVDNLVSKMTICKMLLKENMKDPSSFKELNSITEQMRTGIIRYSATNSFGGRIQQTFNCNQ